VLQPQNSLTRGKYKGGGHKPNLLKVGEPKIRHSNAILNVKFL